MRIFLLLFFLFINLTNFAQLKESNSDKKGNRHYVDLVAGIDPNIAILDRNYNYLLSGYVYILFKNKIYTGLFAEKKLGVTSVHSPIISKFKGGNLSYANAGAYFGGFISFAKLKNGRIRESKRLVRLNISLRTGEGRIWVVNPKNNKLFDRINYLFVLTPTFGIEYPLSKSFAAGFGVTYHFTFNNYAYFKNSDLSGPGAYFNLRFSILNNSYVKENSSPHF